MAMDWLSLKLYWCDEERGYIVVSNLDGSNPAVILWRKNVKPKNLILDLENR